MTDDRIRVVLERSGGLAGRLVRRGLDTADLSADEADRLRLLLTRLPAAAAGQHDPARAGNPRGARAAGPDQFAYAIEVEAGGRRSVHTFAEPIPDGLRPLVRMLSSAPLLPARRG
jgi:hypothetical protein